VRAGPNGADRVLGDKERRVMETFSFTIYDLLLIIVIWVNPRPSAFICG
jgi:hypothetical protein